MRNQTRKGTDFIWFGYFEDSGLDTQVSIISSMAPRLSYTYIFGIQKCEKPV
jgi:hypothetical protein